MSSQQGKWREEQVLIICPGSQTTMAQLGCNELTPPTYRIPTRMFRDEDSEDQWRPYAIVKRKKVLPSGEVPKSDEDEWEYVEDPDSAEGAVYPMQGGHIVNMEALLAFFDHVHSLLTTTYHNTPIVLMASPQWTRPGCETIVRYIFEKTKTPALCLIHSGIATQYGLKWGNLTVVDVGFEKVDVTCIYDSRIVSQREVNLVPGEGRDISGGEVFTMKLLEQLEKQGFDYGMAEQLKKSNVCEVLPYFPDSPSLMDLPGDMSSPTATSSEAPKIGEGGRLYPPARINGEDDGGLGEKEAEDEGVLDVANIVASGNAREFLAKKEREKAEKAKGKRGRDKDAEAAKALRLPNSKRVKNTFHYEEFVTEEFIPEPPKPTAAPVPSAAPTAPSVPATSVSEAPIAAVTSNIPSEAPKAPETPQVPVDPAAPAPAQENGAKDVDMADLPSVNGTTPPEATKPIEGEAPKQENGDQPPLNLDIPKAEDSEAITVADAPPVAAPPAEPVPVLDVAAPAPPAEPEQRTRRVRRDVEVGLERFTFADRHEVDRIVTSIYRAVQGIDDVYMRPQCWENLVFVGNGARLRGLKENIVQTLQARYLISPSTATMFTSELPSNLGTPSGTGAQTPTGSFTGMPHQLPTSSNVNPLLQAATTANLALPGAPGAPGSNAGDAMPSHHSHGQTPTAVKLAPLPTYLSEWTKNGFEEAMFLGAQVAARLAFCVHNLDQQGAESQRYMSLNRVEYNELGPKGIRDHSMLGW